MENQIDLQENAIVCGFRVRRIREVEELGGRLVEFVHEETGAELNWLDNGELNKLFCVAFKTLPEDSTGVFHILEHSVLCGSDKFPVKEPFVELLKSSMNTFLNAITFQDKTVYPVSSRNARDFLNLTEVYLDAVFRPAILSNPNIFYQEGHHIEQDENGGLSFKGVVFNEMKGALSNVDGLVEEKLLELLFPGSPYGVNSGGDPAHIPELTYEKFVDTYRKYYHPSNARIYLDGAVPLEATLKLIAGYLDGAGRGVRIPDAPESVPMRASTQIKYDLAATEPLEDRGIYVQGRILCTWRDKLKVGAANVVLDVLLGSNESPLKREILSSGLAQDVFAYVDPSVPQPYLMLECINVADGRAAELKQLISDTVKQIVANGLDREQIRASMQRSEFNIREQEEPRALNRAIAGLNSWLHDGDMLLYIVNEEDFVKMRSLAEDDTFERLAEEMFVDDAGLAEILALPDHNAGEELRQAEAARLEAIRSTWTEQDLAANRALNEALLAWQQKEDSPEAKATIPVLPLSEISPEPVLIPTEESDFGGVRVLFHNVPSRGIYYINIYFNLSDFTLRELTVLSRIGSYFGTLPTEKYSTLELQQELKKTVGRMDFYLGASADINDNATCTPYFCASFSVLESDYAGAVALLKEILTNTKFDDTGRILEIVKQNDEGIKQFGVTSGHSLGIKEAMSHYSALAAYNEAVGGRTYIMYSHELANNFDANVGELLTAVRRLMGALDRGRMTVSFSSSRPPEPGTLVNAFPEVPADGIPVPESAAFTAEVPERLGCVIPAQIGYAVQCFRNDDADFEYSGSLRVAAKMASLEYLWNAVRVQGGAYGTGLSVGERGTMFTYSYRDPSPDRSLDCNTRIGAFLRAALEASPSIDKYIISTLSDTEPLLSPRAMGNTADNNVLNGITDERIRRTRREILATGPEDIIKACELFDRFAEKGAVCVVAYRDALDKCDGLTVVDL